MPEEQRRASGLRERKKQQTRDTLSMAAIRLVVERGWDAVTVQDIAALADVSVRTFRNYFASKADAIASRHVDRIRRVADELASRPEDEPLWTAVTTAVQTQLLPNLPIGERPLYAREQAEAVRLMLSEPALHGELARAHASARSELVTVIAERTGDDPRRQLRPHLIAGAVTTAVEVAMDHALRSDPPVPLGPLLAEALRDSEPTRATTEPETGTP